MCCEAPSAQSHRVRAMKLGTNSLADLHPLFVPLFVPLVQLSNVAEVARGCPALSSLDLSSCMGLTDQGKPMHERGKQGPGF